MKRTSRKPSNLSESLHRRLNSYALAASAAVDRLNLHAFAASAAGLGLLAIPQTANARIVYTPANVFIHSSLGLDLNHDGIEDFVFFESVFASGGELRIQAQSQNLIWGKSRLASALHAGVNVRSSAKLMASNTLMCLTDSQRSDGHWYHVQHRYLGLKFYVKGKAHYGWARLKTTDCEQSWLTGYAYETVPNKPIKTGQTKGPDVMTVEPGSLGVLAAGALKFPQVAP